jgi:hypothetical protein
MMFHSPLFILGFLPLCLTGFFIVGAVAGGCTALNWLIAASLVFYGCSSAQSWSTTQLSGRSATALAPGHG